MILLSLVWCKVRAGESKHQENSGDWSVSPYPAIDEQRVALLDEDCLDGGDVCGAQDRLATVVDAEQQHIIS